MAIALILFAHGARDPEWAEPVRRVRAAIQSLEPAQRVEVAFLEFMAPTLADCCAGLASEGYRRIVVLPMFIAQGGHLKKDVPLLLEDLRARYPAVQFELAKAVGETEAVIQAIAKAGIALAADSR